jgi:hypothetical protein
MQEATFLILTALAAGSQHGYYRLTPGGSGLLAAEAARLAANAKAALRRLELTGETA